MNEELVKELHGKGYFLLREVPGRGICGIMQQLFTIGLFYGLDESGYEGRYCYQNMNEAQVALFAWTGQGDPPLDWIKHKGKTEYINPKFA